MTSTTPRVSFLGQRIGIYRSSIPGMPSVFYRENPHEFNLSTKSCASFIAFRSVLIGSGLLPARVTPIVLADVGGK
jgi:hypothetical protein